MRSYSMLLVALLALGSCKGRTTTTLATGKCGDDVIDPGEECDGTALGGATCSGTGTVACTAQCRLDASACAGVIMICGDGLITGTENCEGANLDGATCSSIGLADGELACKADCTFDVSGCTGAASCPNGVREFPEACDGADLAGEDCSSLGFADGTLACAANCTFDTTGCNPLPVCGNNTIEDSEVCDGSQLGGEDCASLGLGTGTLACLGNCTDFDTSDCSGTPTCPNGVREYPEECDGSDLAGEDCESLGFVGGSLACASGCTFDTGGCIPNSDPTCAPTPTPAQLDEAGGPVGITFTCTDTDAQILALTDSSTADGVTISDDGPGTTVSVTITLDPDNDDAGVTGSRTFDVAFTIEDTLGGDVTVTQSVTFDNPGPTADAGTDPSGAPGETIALDGTGSSDPDNDALTYSWSAVGTAPALDDPTSPTPSLVGGACNAVYTYELVVNDGVVDSTPDTVTVSMEAQGTLVSVNDCIAMDECGDLTRPWCTIQGGYVAAVTVGAPQVHVKEGAYAQGAVATVNESLLFDASGSVEILGGYTDLSTMARVATASCDQSAEGTGATIVEVGTSDGVQFTAGNTSLWERFCLQSAVTVTASPTGKLVTIDGASPTIRDNMFDAVTGGTFSNTIGIDIINTAGISAIAPVVHDNRDDPTAGAYFGGDGSTSSAGISVSGVVDLDLQGNVIDGGTGGTESFGVLFIGTGSIDARDNVLAGGNATDAYGIWVEGTGAAAASLQRNTITGGSGAQRGVGAYFVSLDTATVEEGNTIAGRSVSGTEAFGAWFDSVALATVQNNNAIKGGMAPEAIGIIADNSTDLAVIGSNTIRGGSTPAMMTGSTTLVGIFATFAGRLRVIDSNVVTGADSDGGALIPGGTHTIGIRASDTGTVEVVNNSEILGGAPSLPASGPVAFAYRGAGIEVNQPDSVNIENNELIQGCSPVCGPGNGQSINPTPATGVGISINAVAGSGGGTKVVQGNSEIRGGPTAGLQALATGTLVVGVEVLGPRVGSGPAVDIHDNTTIAGNDGDDDPTGAPTRANTAIGVRIRHAAVNVGGNRSIIGGRSFGASYGIRLLQDDDVFTMAAVHENGVILGNPFPDAGVELPFIVEGIEFLPSIATGNSWLEVAGVTDTPQEIGGGQARAGAQGTAVGVDVAGLGGIDVRHNALWGGVVPGGLLQVGAIVWDIQTEAVLDSNLIEACGVGDTSSGVHEPGCDDLLLPSSGLVIKDGEFMETWLFNNLVFGGFSPMGSTGAMVVDSGPGAGGVLLYHNYFNAQGPASAVCAPGSPVAEGIRIVPAPGGSSGGGVVEIVNNIIDGGGRACTRYGIAEMQTGIGTTFDGVVVSNNGFVQINTDRDAAGQTWGYLESDGDLFCEAGVDTIAPGDCLDNPNAPSPLASYADNVEGDPEFAGDDVAMSELPGYLPWSDFGVSAAVLQGAGLDVGVAYDYLDGARADPPDIGHDE